MSRHRVERKPLHSDPISAIHAVSLGMVRQVDARDARKRELGLRETLQMFQVQTAGEAGNKLGWVTVAIEFDYHFYYSPGDNETDYDTPNLMVGGELDAPVLVTAYVQSWARDPDNEAVTGATVNVGAVAPGVKAAVSWSGKIHLTFAGWASLFEDETEMQE